MLQKIIIVIRDFDAIRIQSIWSKCTSLNNNIVFNDMFRKHAFNQLYCDPI